jgi:hypothetical protein
VDTYVYVDGLNFYYGALVKTPYKWLDYEALSRLLVPHDNDLQDPLFHRQREAPGSR